MNASSRYSAKSQSLGLSGIGNARELGGYEVADGRQVRRGLLLRTAAPEGATEADRVRLERDLKLTCVLDLRMDMERQMLKGSASPLGFAENHVISILDQDYYARLYEGIDLDKAMATSPLERVIMGVDLGVIGETMYIGFLEAESGKCGYREVFERLLAQPADEALLFHCTQGKDRTGLAAMLILSVLGADDDTIVFDYLLTNTFNAALIERERQALLAMGTAERDLDRYLIGFDMVAPATMQRALDHLRATYGSVWGYCRDELGVEEDGAKELRAKYLV